MGSEVCPYCGKTYKRLKSHLPHCKAAASSTPPSSQHDVPRQSSSSELVATSRKMKPKEKSAQTPSAATGVQRSRSKDVSWLSTKQLQSSPTATSASGSLSSIKKKQTVADQIKMASSASVSPISPASAQPKHKSLKALTAAARAETKTNSQIDCKPKGAYKKNTPRIQNAAEHPPVIRNASDTLYGDRNKTNSGNNVWVHSEDLNTQQVLIKPRNGQQGRITLQDVKATLRRAKATGRTSTPNIASSTQTTDDLSSKNQTDAACSVKAKAPSEQLPVSSSQHPESQSVKRRSLLSEQASLIPLQHDAAPQPKPNSPAGPLLSGHLPSQAAPLSHTIGTGEGLKVCHHRTALLSMPKTPSLISSPLPFLLAPPVRVETSRADEGSTKEKLQLRVRKQDAAEGALTQRPLGRVRLRELPEWLACKTPRTPRDLLEIMQRGWQWYHRRYIDVKKGGVGGVAMLLAGYCVLSYSWNYPHIKHDRWRKYH